MSDTLFNVIFAWKCTSTHHKLAMDALNRLQGSQAANWRDLCLNHIGAYLEGSKAPDDQFKDFRNHVLHIREGLWGGAMTAASHWYRETVSALRARDWKEAVFAAGVLSHYYSDPIQPFHTGQSEAEGIVHRAAEWSIACAYRELTDLLEAQLGGWPSVNVPSGRNWLETMVSDGARLANPHYEFCIDHYNINIGVKNPPAGLDQTLRECIARLLGHAVVGFARITEQAIAEAAVEIPASNLTLQNVVTRLTIPIAWVTKKLKDAKDRAAVQAIYNEFQETGKVLKTLPEDELFVRQAHAQEVLRKPLAELDREKPRKVGTAYSSVSEKPLKEQVLRHDGAHSLPKPHIPVSVTPQVESEPPAPQITDKTDAVKADPEKTLPMVRSGHTSSTPEVNIQYFLTRDMPVEKAPSIGSKTAKALARCGVLTVSDLLGVEPEQLAAELGDRRIRADDIQDWKWQAELCCTVPRLRGHDAQFLVACDIHSAAELAAANSEVLFRRVHQFVDTPAGQRILREGKRPDLKEVNEWILSSQQGLSRRAA